jgi:hypothetical protein
MDSSIITELGLDISAQSCVTIRAPLNFLRTWFFMMKQKHFEVD